MYAVHVIAIAINAQLIRLIVFNAKIINILIQIVNVKIAIVHA